ncbi:MAG: DUF4874 domain-containing protein [Opitutales bacterium]
MAHPTLPRLALACLGLVAALAAKDASPAERITRNYHGIWADDPTAANGLINPDRGFRLECPVGAGDGVLLVTLADGTGARRRGGKLDGVSVFPSLDVDAAKVGWSDRAMAESLARLQAAGLTTHLGICWLDEYASKPLDAALLARLDKSLDVFRRAGARVILRFAYELDRRKTAGPTLATVTQHIEALRPVLARNADVILAVQMGFVGHRGEIRDAARIPEDLAAHAAVLKALIAARPPGRPLQVRSATMRAALLGALNLAPSIIQADAFEDRTPAAFIGMHNVGFGADNTDDGTFESVGQGDAGWRTWCEQGVFVPVDADLGPGFASARTLEDGWNLCVKAAMERVVTLGVNRAASTLSPTRTPGPVDAWKTQMKTREEVLARGLPVSDGYFSDSKGNAVPRSAHDYLRDHLGYRYELISASWPSSVKQGETYELRIRLTNRGFAACPTARTLDLAYAAKSGRYIYAPGTGESFDIRRILPAAAIGPEAAAQGQEITCRAQAPNAPGKHLLVVMFPEAQPPAAPTTRRVTAPANASGPPPGADARRYIRFANRDAPHWVASDKTCAGAVLGEIEITR